MMHRRPTPRRSSTSKLSQYFIIFVFTLLICTFVIVKELRDSSKDTALSQSLLNFADTAGHDYQLANDQSFGFFDDVPESEWKLLSNIVKEHENHAFMDQPLTFNPAWEKRTSKYFSSPRAWYQNNYEPNFSCRFERRIGGNGNGDGPKWVCDPHRLHRISSERKAKNPNAPGCVVYSFGSNGDFSFEDGFQRALGKDTCEIHIFDMGDYESKMPADLNLHYHKWGLMAEPEGYDKNDNNDIKPENREFLTLRETVKVLGHEDLDAIDVFKIDCDKCEWKTFQDWVDPRMPRLQQILVETHNVPNKFVLSFFDTFEKEGYVRFHKEANVQFSDGDCFEYAFLKLDKEFF